VARYAAVIGPQARELEPLLRTELDMARRHNRRTGSFGYGTGDIRNDEALRRECRTALAQFAC
jgi:hypothetical protein